MPSRPLESPSLLRRRRATRRYSPLTRRILLLNIIPVALLTLGAVYLSDYEEELIDAELASLAVQGEMVAAGIGEVAVAGGETTVTVRGKGRGGRNVEYLLGKAIEARGAAGIWGLAADTDGVDGAEDIAGGLFTPDSLARARALGRDPKAMLDDNDGHSFFEMLGDSIVTGPTRTNVNDFRATLIVP